MASAPLSPKVTLAKMDLNLLVAFDALWSERSVTRAGRTLGLSQPAMSGALARLRTMFDDPLFLRSRGGLAPTERCVEIAEPVTGALRVLLRSVEARRFDPATSERVFAIGAVDAAVAVVMPRVVRRVAVAAPRVRLNISGLDPRRAAELVDEDQLDVALAPVDDAPASVASRVLFPIQFLLVMRRGHPLAARTPTTTDLAEWPSVAVAFRGLGPLPIDQQLATRGLQRRIVATVDSFLAVPPMLAGTDALAILPAPYAKMLEREPGNLLTKPFPGGGSPSLKMRLLWSERQTRSAASRWLRDTIADAAREAKP
jgi:DNA-binding transcriptional LysR family regulator